MVDSKNFIGYRRYEGINNNEKYFLYRIALLLCISGGFALKDPEGNLLMASGFPCVSNPLMAKRKIILEGLK